MDLPSPNATLEGDSWPGSVSVVRAEPMDGRVSLEVIGEHADHLYQRLRFPDDLDKIVQWSGPSVGLSGQSEAFFLGIEAHRIGYAFQLDSLYTVNVSQLDALPD
jgi:hypothetical protein